MQVNYWIGRAASAAALEKLRAGGVTDLESLFERFREIRTLEGAARDDESDAQLLAKHVVHLTMAKREGATVVESATELLIERSDDGGATWAPLSVMQAAMVEIHARGIRRDPKKLQALLSFTPKRLTGRVETESGELPTPPAIKGKE